MSWLLSREKGNRTARYSNMGECRGSMGVTLLWILLWISRYCQGLSAEQLSKKIFFVEKTSNRVTLPVSPAVPKGTAHQWIWTSHDGRHSNTSVAQITSPMNRQDPISQGTGYDLSIQTIFENAGEFVFMQTKPDVAVLARFEVFSFVFKVTPIDRVNQVYLGSDVSVRCEVSSLPEGATLQWEREGDPTSNTTLFYNNTAHMVIHTVDQNYRGRYNCNFRLNGELLFTVYTKLNVQTHTYSRPLIHLFRESSNSSEVNLICRYISTYHRAEWTVTKSVTLTSYNTESLDKVRRDRFSSPPFNGYDFPLHVSPVTFEDGGMFTCFFEGYIFGSVKLTTIRVSESGGPPGGQPVVLRCEVSEVSGDPVTLAWMRMEGSRGLLVKQDILTESHPNRTLSVTLPSLCRDQLHWQCVVFTEGMLRATASLTLTLPTNTPMSSMTDDNHLQTVIIVACTAMVVAGVLVGALVFYLKRKKTAVTTLTLTQKNDPVYGNITDPQRDQESQGGQTGEDENEEVHYSEFALCEPRLGDPNIVTAGSNQERAVIYSPLNI
ncbi:uncharacterized protein LOC121536686 isoform X1 [Coregonus clupeaformis]|uniref:uncharacterized protein LOC121536686 isoform X1 n=2 Tax=Coregonus clupeaformis TaxID=59861 RepID=UPI001E1C3018|nr:uncharacterized protein LOC121536686 isoform X1 [Coregonus clupeaformis]